MEGSTAEKVLELFKTAWVAPRKTILLRSSESCELNVGQSEETLSLKATLINAWLSHDETRIVLELRSVVATMKKSGELKRDEALAYIAVEKIEQEVSEFT